MDFEEIKRFEEKLEANGEEKVSKQLAMGIYGVSTDPRTKAPLVKDWLEKKEAQRQEIKRQEELGINKEANRIAKEANQISKSAKNASWWALVISIISIIVSILTVLLKK